MPDPVPYRCGVWRGHSDAVEVPVIEKPQRRQPKPRTRERAAVTAEAMRRTARRSATTTAATDSTRPVKSAVAAFIGEAGVGADHGMAARRSGTGDPRCAARSGAA